MLVGSLAPAADAAKYASDLGRGTLVQLTLPNLLTVSRLVAIPVLMALLLVRFPGHDQIAAALFLMVSFTDTLDGQIARRRGLVSDLGKFLDPLADKLLVLSVLIVLVQEGLVAAWVVVVIFSRELLITILRSVGASQGRVIAAAPLGKTKTVTHFTIGSGIDYLVRFRHLIGLGGRPSGSSPVDPMADELGTTLIREQLTLSVAESCTGGLLGALITDRPGSSAYFLGGVIAYGDEVKRDELNVPATLLTRHGAVSREVALAMADGARARFGSSLAVSTTGIAGPDSDGSSKPVGLTYIAVASQVGRRCEEFRFTGDRWSNRRQAVAEALRMLIEEVQAVAGRQKSRPA